MMKYLRGGVAGLVVLCLAIRIADWLLEPVLGPAIVLFCLIGILGTIYYGKWA